MISQQVVMSHPNFSKISRVVFVEVRAVMVLSSCHATTTRMLSMFAYTTVAGTDVAATRLLVLAGTVFEEGRSGMK